MKKYLTNVGNSVVFTLKEVITKSLLPNTSSAIQNNTDFVKDGVAMLTNSRKLTQALQRSLDPELAKAFRDVTKNTMSDLKSGQLFNQKRADDKANDWGGGGDDDWGGGDDSWDGGDDDDGGRPKVVNNNRTIVNNIVRSSSGMSLDPGTHGRLNKLAQISMVSAETNVKALSQINDTLAKIQRFNLGQVSEFHNVSVAYYTESAQTLQKIHEALTKQGEGAGSDKERGNHRIFGSGGDIDLDAYFKHVQKRMKDKHGDTYDQLVQAGSQIAANPIGTLLTMAVESIIPDKIKKQAGQFDKAVGSIMPNILLRLATIAKKGDGGALGGLADLLGIDVNVKHKADMSEYTKGQVPFDGITKKAIIEVIPGLLSKIHAALTGRKQEDEHIYDYEKGKFTTRGRAAKDLKDEMEQALGGAMSDFRSAIYDQITKEATKKDGSLPKNFDLSKHEKAVQGAMAHLAKAGVELHGGGKNTNGAVGDNVWETLQKAGVDKPTRNAVSRAFKGMSRADQMYANKQLLQAVESANQLTEDREFNDHSMHRQAFNFDPEVKKRAGILARFSKKGGSEFSGNQHDVIKVFIAGGFLDSIEKCVKVEECYPGAIGGIPNGRKKGKGGTRAAARVAPEPAQQVQFAPAPKVGYGAGKFTMAKTQPVRTAKLSDAEKLRTQKEISENPMGYIANAAVAGGGGLLAGLGLLAAAPFVMMGQVLGLVKPQKGGVSSTQALAGAVPEGWKPGPGGVVRGFSEALNSQVILPAKEYFLGVMGPDGKRHGGVMGRVGDFFSRFRDEVKGLFWGVEEGPQGKSFKGIFGSFWQHVIDGSSALWEESGDYLWGHKGPDGKRDGKGVLASSLSGVSKEFKHLGNKFMKMLVGEEKFNEITKEMETKDGMVGGAVKVFTGALDGVGKGIHGFFFGGEDVKEDGLFGKAKGLFPFLKQQTESMLKHGADWIFGKKDEQGKWNGGLMRGLGRFLEKEIFKPFRDTVTHDWVKIKTFFQIEVIDQLRGTLQPFVEELKLQTKRLKEWTIGLLKSASGAVVRALDNFFLGTVGKRMTDMFTDVFIKPLRTSLGMVKNILGKGMAGVIKLPVDTIRNISDNLRTKHDTMGMAYTKEGTGSSRAEIKKSRAAEIAERRKDPAVKLAEEQYEETKKSGSILDSMYKFMTMHRDQRKQFRYEMGEREKEAQAAHEKAEAIKDKAHQKVLRIARSNGGINDPLFRQAFPWLAAFHTMMTKPRQFRSQPGQDPTFIERMFPTFLGVGSKKEAGPLRKFLRGVWEEANTPLIGPSLALLKAKHKFQEFMTKPRNLPRALFDLKDSMWEALTKRINAPAFLFRMSNWVGDKIMKVLGTKKLSIFGDAPLNLINWMMRKGFGKLGSLFNSEEREAKREKKREDYLKAVKDLNDAKRLRIEGYKQKYRDEEAARAQARSERRAHTATVRGFDIEHRKAWIAGDDVAASAIKAQKASYMASATFGGISARMDAKAKEGQRIMFEGKLLDNTATTAKHTGGILKGIIKFVETIGTLMMLFGGALSALTSALSGIGATIIGGVIGGVRTLLSDLFPSLRVKLPAGELPHPPGTPHADGSIDTAPSRPKSIREQISSLAKRTRERIKGAKDGLMKKLGFGPREKVALTPQRYHARRLAAFKSGGSAGVARFEEAFGMGSPLGGGEAIEMGDGATTGLSKVQSISNLAESFKSNAFGKHLVSKADYLKNAKGLSGQALLDYQNSVSIIGKGAPIGTGGQLAGAEANLMLNAPAGAPTKAPGMLSRAADWARDAAGGMGKAGTWLKGQMGMPTFAKGLDLGKTFLGGKFNAGMEMGAKGVNALKSSLAAKAAAFALKHPQLAGGARFMGKAAAPIGLMMSALDGIWGYGDADKNFAEENSRVAGGRNADWRQKLASAAGGAVSGGTLGFAGSGKQVSKSLYAMGSDANDLAHFGLPPWLSQYLFGQKVMGKELQGGLFKRIPVMIKEGWDGLIKDATDKIGGIQNFWQFNLTDPVKKVFSEFLSMAGGALLHSGKFLLRIAEICGDAFLGVIGAQFKTKDLVGAIVDKAGNAFESVKGIYKFVTDRWDKMIDAAGDIGAWIYKGVSESWSKVNIGEWIAKGISMIKGLVPDTSGAKKVIESYTPDSGTASRLSDKAGGWLNSAGQWISNTGVAKGVKKAWDETSTTPANTPKNGGWGFGPNQGGDNPGEAASSVPGAPWFKVPPGGQWSVSSPYGQMRAKGPHQGWDFAVPSNTPVASQTDGEVTYVNNNWANGGTTKENGGGYGNTAYIKDSKGMYHIYGHLTQAQATMGQKVKRGQIIGKSGSTGNSSGPHLHYQVSQSPGGRGGIDGRSYLTGQGISTQPASISGAASGTDGSPGGSPGGATAAPGGNWISQLGSFASGLLGSVLGQNVPGGDSSAGSTPGGMSSGALGMPGGAPGSDGAPIGKWSGKSDAVAKTGQRQFDQWDPFLVAAAQKYKVPPNLLKAIMMRESNGDPNAGSGAGAIGLMQVMPLHYDDVYGKGKWSMQQARDPATNTMMGARVLSQEMRALKGEAAGATYWDDVLRSYNGGSGTFATYKRTGFLPKETREYTGFINANLSKLGGIGGGEGISARAVAGASYLPGGNHGLAREMAQLRRSSGVGGGEGLQSAPHPELMRVLGAIAANTAKGAGHAEDAASHLGEMRSRRYVGGTGGGEGINHLDSMGNGVNRVSPQPAPRGPRAPAPPDPAMETLRHLSRGRTAS
jgi:murein DD-endopeptidase MepM/ murein hydrolase activator NlpD